MAQATAGTGKNAVFDFGGTVYESLTQMSIDSSTEEITIIASSDGTGNPYTYRATGASSWTFPVTLVLPAGTAGSTMLNALKNGTSDTLDVYPHGDETGSIEFAFSAAETANMAVPSDPGSFATLDITFICTGEPTIGTKSA